MVKAARVAAILAIAVVCVGCTGGERPAPSHRVQTVQAPAGVLVPHLVGLDREEAERALETRGLFVEVQPVGEPADDLVVGQRPRPDVRIPPHSLVVLRVRCLPAPCPSPPAGATIFDPCSCAYR